MAESWVTTEVVAAVARHMNDDHAADNIVICQVAGGRPDTTAAVMTGLDPDGIDFTATTPDGEVAVRVPFGRRLAERAEVRTEVARLYHESAAALGL